MNTGLTTANSGIDILQLAALLGGSQQQSGSFQAAQLLQVRQALAQQQAAQVAANQATLTKRIEEEAQQKVEVLVNAEKCKRKKATRDKTTNNKPLDDDMCIKRISGRMVTRSPKAKVDH